MIFTKSLYSPQRIDLWRYKVSKCIFFSWSAYSFRHRKFNSSHSLHLFFLWTILHYHEIEDFEFLRSLFTPTTREPYRRLCMVIKTSRVVQGCKWGAIYEKRIQDAKSFEVNTVYQYPNLWNSSKIYSMPYRYCEASCSSYAQVASPCVTRYFYRRHILTMPHTFIWRILSWATHAMPEHHGVMLCGSNMTCRLFASPKHLVSIHLGFHRGGHTLHTH